MKKLEYKFTVFIGDVSECLGVAAKTHDINAFLVDYTNYKEIMVSTLTKDTTVYTSLGDLPKDLKIIWNILNFADVVVYCPPDHWSDNKKLDFINPGTCVQGLTEKLLILLPKSIQIININLSIPDPVPLVDIRRSNSPQLWIAGCSISHGVGVEKHERYGELLANQLSLPSSFLTKPSAAIDWAADQILRSDICEDDIVVWGLTSTERLTHIHNNKLLSITPYICTIDSSLEKIVKIDNLYSQTTIYKHFYAIRQVINYCQKCKAKLILVRMLSGGGSLERALTFKKNYVHIPYQIEFNGTNISENFIDLGNDHQHPGPKQHHQYKQLILEKIKELKYI